MVSCRNSRYIASGSDDRTVETWDVEQECSVATLRGHSNVVFSVNFNPQGTLIASSSFDDSVRIWDFRTGRIARMIPANSDPVTAASFNRDGTLLVSTTMVSVGYGTSRLTNARRYCSGSSASLRVLASLFWCVFVSLAARLLKRPLVAALQLVTKPSLLTWSTHLMTSTGFSGLLSLLAAFASMDKSYASPVSTTNVYPTYARQLLYNDLTSSMWTGTQYWWVDLDHQFEVAHTTERQQHCRDQYSSNSAVYMETVLRNQLRIDYIANYGGDDGHVYGVDPSVD
ncbi:Aste57867_3768 [Aphanomyces stellatus]|uniref:Aste57867_3768 protein n=1 Tax=Aphanomyces stellatus TaxID=120398 RepID=A0A485KG10_9STRA|nr:hypothetical protein As57867_003757 [Aphanomyces stellatus]VFT80919.1 Aste57867_3768 [Aphanomyces stellatus]